MFTGSKCVLYVAGDWVLVKYHDMCHPGRITEIIERDYEVSVMVKTGNYWKWPIKEDKIMYKAEDVLRQIKPPEFRQSAGSRQFKGQCSFTDLQ